MWRIPCLSQKIVVKIDAEIKDLIPGYLENRRAEIIELVRLCEKRDQDAIAKISHKLKGNAGGYGFTELGELAKKLENSAKSAEWKAVNETIEGMRVYLDRIVIEYVEVSS